MHDREQAVSILKQARDILAERLAERVCELRDELLAEAIGLENHGDIEATYDQIGMRLAHVNAMLGALPPLEPPQDPAAEPEEEPSGRLAIPAPQPPLVQADTAAGLVAETAEAVQTRALVPAAEPASFQGFLTAIRGGQLTAAGRVLAELLELDCERATRCAARFRGELLQNPGFLAKPVQLRAALEQGAVNDSLALLWECFGLQGVESIRVFETLRQRLSAESAPQ